MTTLANGQQLTSMRVTIPNRGRMIVAASAGEPVPLVAGLLTFTLEDMSILAKPMPGRVGEFAGQWSCEAVGGRGGWGSIIPAKGYQSPIGIPFGRAGSVTAAARAWSGMAAGTAPRAPTTPAWLSTM